MDSGNSKPSKLHVSILKLTNKLDLRIEDYRLIKSLYLLHVEKHKKLIQ